MRNIYILISLFLCVGVLSAAAPNKTAVLKQFEVNGITNKSLKEALFQIHFQGLEEEGKKFLEQAVVEDSFLARCYKALYSYKGLHSFNVERKQSKAFITENAVRLNKMYQNDKNIEAAYIMAYAHYLKIFDESNEDTSGNLALAAAKKKHLLASVLYGLVIEAGTSKKHRSKKLQALLLKKALQAGSLKALSLLVKIKLNTRNKAFMKEAQKLLVESISRKHGEASYNAAVIFLDLRQNKQAVASLKAAVSLNYKKAHYVLGNIYLDGRHGEKENIPLGMKHMQTAADMGYAPACEKLSEYFRWGQKGLSRNKREGLYWIEMAAFYDPEHYAEEAAEYRN